MSDAARLARESFSSKPQGTTYSKFRPSVLSIAAINSKINDAFHESSYAAVISYAEALSGLKHGSVSWSIIRLYYSCFYCIRALLLANQIIPFNCDGEMILDVANSTYLRGGRSSHHWNWENLRRIQHLSNQWYFSEDSQDSYKKLRDHRENVNYTHTFTDPYYHKCLVSSENDLAKRYRTYKDDDDFLYTYLDDHLALAYPTKLIFAVESAMKKNGNNLADEKKTHVRRIWDIASRCPLT